MIDTKMTIRNQDGSLVWSGNVDDSSYRSKEVMGDNKLFLHLSSDTPVQMSLFASTTFKGEKYFLWKPENFKKLNTENHEYKLEMDTYLIYLKSQKYEFFTSTTSKDIEITFSLSASPRRFAQLAADNMNMKDEEEGWTVGDCITADEVNLDFDDMTIWDALNMVAERFSTEWEVEGKTIHIRKVQKMEEDPVPLTYGNDGGILPGISRSNGTGRVGVLRVKTSNRNIDSISYGFNTLRMPRDFIIDWEDTRYTTDKNGTKLRKYNPEHKYPVVPEATLDLTEIYPHREGVVSWTGVEEIEVDGADGKEKVERFFIEDSSIPDDLNYNNYIIGGATGTKPTIVFQSGQLSGLEFEIKYDHAGRKFTITPNTENGVTYPNSAMRPGIGNKYVVLNVMLPKSYVEEAEYKVLDKAAEYLYENEGDRYIYHFELDPIYAKRNWGSISGYLNIGYFVEFSDPQYLAEPVNIRITGITEYVNRPYSPKITLSNNVRSQSIGADIRQVQNIQQTIRRTGKGISRLTEVRWRDLEELFEMLHNMLHLGFTEGIRPVVINSMMAYFGSEQLQFRWVDSKEDPITEVDMYYEVDNEKQTFMVDGGIIQHMTLGIDSMQPDYGANDYHFWDIRPLPPTYVGNRGFLWLYLRCQKDGPQGVFVLSETEIELEAVGGYYHFLCGSLNSPFEGTRNFFTWYGFSVITPGQLRIPKIASADGKQWIDFINKGFHLGDGANFLSYNEDKDGQLTLKGVMVQSPSGETDVLEVDRGDWNAGIQYYPGDKIKYSNGNIYKCVKQTKGIVPTNTEYWRLLVTRGDRGPSGSNGADGKDGIDGMDAIMYEYIYYASEKDNPPARPSSIDRDGHIPNGWSSIPDIGTYDYLYTTNRKKERGKWSDWEDPVLFSRSGRNGRIFSYMGAWEYDKEYLGDEEIAQVVLVEEINRYFYTTISAGLFRDVYPPNDDKGIYWKKYGGNFESIATGLLFAKDALISGFNFTKDRIESFRKEGGQPAIILDGLTGDTTITGRLRSSSKGRKVEIDPSDGAIYFTDKEGLPGIYMGFDYGNIFRIGGLYQIQIGGKFEREDGSLTPVTRIVVGDGGFLKVAT